MPVVAIVDQSSAIGSFATSYARFLSKLFDFLWRKDNLVLLFEIK
jgi:hypothetical protein